MPDRWVNCAGALLDEDERESCPVPGNEREVAMLLPMRMNRSRDEGEGKWKLLQHR